LTTAADGKKYRTKFYNLDAIIAVGYRVRSHRGTQFRQWATERLREFIVKGFVLDDERLKEPGGIDYFDDNKLHFAISGKTAAELISERADAAKPNMGLTSWKGAKVRLRDVTIAKNYLNEKELEGLNRVVTMYLDYAEDQAKRHRHIFMRDWREKLDAFLQFNERDILTNAGKVSKAVADSLALEQYDRFNQQRLYQEAEREALEDDRELQQIKQNLEDRLTGGRNKK
ncbi:MAG: virulence RhuM family protein, partial [Desulfobulbaceae bacterium]|nr:virulence RhuM family protein [Desulfobulbaceae bacterium]